MLIYGHLKHRYEDRATGKVYQIPQGGVAEIPDGLAKEMLSQHPGKLCNVTGEVNPSAHRCPISEKVDAGVGEYRTTNIPAPQKNTMMVATERVSPQKRILRKKALKRSRLYRLEANKKQVSDG